MPAPLGLVIGRNDRWPRTKETPLEGHRGSTRIFLLLVVSSPLSRFSFDWNHRGRAKDQDRAKFRKRFERNLRKKKKSILEGRTLQSEGGLITRNTWSSCYFSLYLYLPFDSNEWWTRRTVDQDRVENARRKRSWETVTKWTRKNLFVLLLFRLEKTEELKRQRIKIKKIVRTKETKYLYSCSLSSSVPLFFLAPRLKRSRSKNDSFL